MYLYKVKNKITRTLILRASSSGFTVDLEEAFADWEMRHHKLVIVIIIVNMFFCYILNPGEQARQLLIQSNINPQLLAQIW